MKKMKSPIDSFFKLGDKITKGDIKKKTDYDYALLWVMFLAFLLVFFDNLYLFYKTLRFYNLGWSLVILAILYFQYWGLKGTYEMRMMLKKMDNDPEKVESPDKMMEGFDEMKDGNKSI